MVLFRVMRWPSHPANGVPVVRDEAPNAGLQGRNLHLIDIPTPRVAHEVLAERELMILALVLRFHAVENVVIASLVPHAGCDVVNPRLIRCREVKDGKAVTLVLVGICHAISNRGVALQRKLDGVVADSNRGVARIPPNNAVSPLVLVNPENRVVEAAHAEDSDGAILNRTRRIHVEDIEAPGIVVDS